MGAPAAVLIHVATVVPAFFIGTWQIFGSRKGSPAHRGLGALYLVLMTATALTAIFIHTTSFSHLVVGRLQLSWIHLFVPLTLYGVVGSVLALRRHDVAGHKRAMLSTYLGALVIAGGFAFTPGRIMYEVFLR
jgi:uncharacterized membrane protein